jgi:hypothetical protein
MSKLAITAMLALGIGAAAPVTSHAAAVPTPTGMQAALAAIDTVEFAQFVNKKPGAVVPRGGPGRVGPGPGAGARFGGPGPGGARFVGRPGGPGFVGRPGYVGRPAFVGGPRFVGGYRPWYRRPHFGTVIGGIALGTIVAATAVGVAPAYAPAPGTCWYWADEYQSRGYWDYC